MHVNNCVVRYLHVIFKLIYQCFISKNKTIDIFYHVLLVEASRESSLLLVLIRFSYPMSSNNYRFI